MFLVAWRMWGVLVAGKYVALVDGRLMMFALIEVRERIPTYPLVYRKPAKITARGSSGTIKAARAG
jgi:hypothetical protein